MNETLLNKARLNVVSLNKALINGAVERHGSSAGGGGAPSKYIRFADPAVEAVLMANGVSSDGVGITKEDAAAVTSIGTWFKGNTEITSFDEFEKFTGVTFLGASTNQTTGGAFNGCTSLRSIKLPSSVTHLRPGAFNNCTSLRSVGDLSNVTRIDIYAFAGTPLEGEINLASAEEEIGYSSFTKTNITKIVSLGNATIIGGSSKSNTGAFAECGLLQSVELPSTLKEIRNWAFYKCTSLEIVICRATTPPSLANANAFNNTNNCPIYVPDAALEVYKTATNWSAYADRIHPLSELEGSPYIRFADPEVERVLMENNVSSDGVGITMADAQAVTSIGTWFKRNTAITSFNELALFVNVQTLSAYAFEGCTALASIDLSNVIAIENNAFQNCSSLSYVGSLAKVTFLRGNAFRDCANLKQEIEMPMLTEITSGSGQLRGAGITSFTALNLKNTSMYMLDSCTNLKHVRLQAVETITNMAFANCTALEYIIIDNAVVPTLSHSNAFNQTNNCPIYVPDASLEAYRTATNWVSYASRIKPLSEYVES